MILIGEMGVGGASLGEVVVGTSTLSEAGVVSSGEAWCDMVEFVEASVVA